MPCDPAAALPAPLRTLVSRGVPHRYPKDTLLIHEGDRSDALFVILSGKVKAFSTDERDREIVYGIYGPGEYLGEMSLDGGPRSASVKTLEVTECVVITRHTLREHIAANPEFAFELLARVIQRARVATQSARSMALLDVYGRVAGLLNDMAVRQPDGSRVIEPCPTHKDIASRVGCSREMVSRLMKDLSVGGYLLMDARRATIARPLPPRW
ncbi:MAG: Crp/Fnr family transcriptional regulator [Methylibium sp. NZG]|nr:MAG: Crp/Fnr family transcriptional regulator [Methylibium sp. NZG]